MVHRAVKTKKSDLKDEGVGRRTGSAQRTCVVDCVVRLLPVAGVLVVRVDTGLEPASLMLTLQSSWSSHRHQTMGLSSPSYTQPRTQSSAQCRYVRHGTPGQNVSSIQPRYTSAQQQHTPNVTLSTSDTANWRYVALVVDILWCPALSSSSAASVTALVSV